jgi:hypothetical protein
VCGRARVCVQVSTPALGNRSRPKVSFMICVSGLLSRDGGGSPRCERCPGGGGPCAFCAGERAGAGAGGSPKVRLMGVEDVREVLTGVEDDGIERSVGAGTRIGAGAGVLERGSGALLVGVGERSTPVVDGGAERSAPKSWLVSGRGSGRVSGRVSARLSTRIFVLGPERSPRPKFCMKVAMPSFSLLLSTCSGSGLRLGFGLSTEVWPGPGLRSARGDGAARVEVEWL